MQEVATELSSHRGNDRKIEKFIINSVLISSHPELNMSLSTTRLRKELRELQKNPLQHIRAAPKETNILEWHYVIIGQEKTLYEGGYYYGTVVFPSEYPFKPPTIRMMTPSGRFKPGARLCLSMSDFHPETWNPMWSVGTILMGLYSFMLDSDITNGSVESSDEEKRQLAKASLAHNIQHKLYCELFPDLVTLHHERKQKEGEQGKVEEAEVAVQKVSSDETVTTVQSPSAVTTSTNTRSSTPDAAAEKVPSLPVPNSSSGSVHSTSDICAGIAAMELPTPPKFSAAPSGSEGVIPRIHAKHSAVTAALPPQPVHDDVGATTPR